MAYPNYQIPTKLTFFPSYLQYAYATGQIFDAYALYYDPAESESSPDSVSTTSGVKKEDIYEAMLYKNHCNEKI